MYEIFKIIQDFWDFEDFLRECMRFLNWFAPRIFLSSFLSFDFIVYHFQDFLPILTGIKWIFA